MIEDTNDNDHDSSWYYQPLPPPVGAKRRPPQHRSKLVAALFALFLGWFGMHRFYLGRATSGFLYLLFFWTLIPAFMALGEAIRLLLMTEEQFGEEYCQ